MNSKKSEDQSGVVSMRLVAGVAAMCLLPFIIFAAEGPYPAWWISRKVVNTGTLAALSGTNDYAGANQGQVKNMAAAAVAEFDADLPGGAGEPLHNLINGWNTPTAQTNDYAAVNIGQLKALAQPFYDRLINLGYATQYPWVGSSNPANDYAAANIGQVKNLFSFNPSLFPQITGPMTFWASISSPFSYAITADNSPTLYTQSGLPAGLMLNGTTGVISGTASTTGIYNVTLSAINTSGTYSVVLAIDVTSGTISVPVINSGTAAVATSGSSFTYQIAASNNPTGFNATNLPPSLTVDPFGGLISGTLSGTASGMYAINLSASNGAGTGTQVLELMVNTVPVISGSEPMITSGTAVTGTAGMPFIYNIAATNNPTSYSASLLPDGLTLSGSTISGTVSASGSYGAVISASNAYDSVSEALTITITSSTPTITSPLTAFGSMGVNFYYAITANNNPTSYASSTLPLGLILDTATGQISGLPTQTGTYTVTISDTNSIQGSGTEASLNIEIVGYPLITSGTADTTTVGMFYYYAINASNSPTSYGATGLPAGLELDPAAGEIMGTPTVPGVYSIALNATNSGTAGGTGTAALILTVANNGPQTPTITSPQIIYSYENTAYSGTITAAFNPASFAVTGLPSGLTLNTTTGAISGTWPSVGAYPITLNTVNASGTATQQMVLVAESSSTTVSAIIQLQAGVSPTATYQTTSATILSDTGTPGVADQTWSGLAVGDNGTSRIERGLIGFDLSMLPPDAIVSEANLALNVTSAPSTSSVALYQTSVLFFPGAATWSANSVTGTFLDSLTITGTGVQSWSSSGTGTNFAYAAEVAISSRVPFDVMLLDGTAEANIGANYDYTFSDETDSTLDNHPMLSLNYTTSSPPVILPGQTVIVDSGVPFSYQASVINSATSIGVFGSRVSGISIDASTGIISGSIAASGTYAVALTATNANGIGNGTVMFWVGNPPGLPGSLTATSGTTDAPYTYTISSTYGATTYTLSSTSSLPQGLQLDSQTGVISGTVSDGHGGTHTASIIATNAFGSTISQLTINIIQPVPTFGNSTLPSACGNQYLYFYYTVPDQTTVTGAPTSYSISIFPSNPGLTIDTWGDIYGVATGTGQFTATITGSNSGGNSNPVTIQINILPLPMPDIPPQTVYALSGSEFNYSVCTTSTTAPNSSTDIITQNFSSTNLPYGLTVDPSSGTISGTVTTGTYNVTVTAQNVSSDTTSGSSCLGSGTLTLEICPPGPIITSTLVASGAQGASFSYTLTGTFGDPATIVTSATGLPPELGLSYTDNGGDPSSAFSGTISGTPTLGGAFNVILTASDSVGTTSGTLVLSILGSPIVTSSNTVMGAVGVPFSGTIAGSNDPTNFTVNGVGNGNLPAWATLNGSVISGTPNAADLVPLSVTISNAAGTSTSPLLMIITASPSDYLEEFQQGVSPTSTYSVPAASINSSLVDGTSGPVSVIPVGVSSGSIANRSFLAFDLSSLPPGATITSADLVLTATSSNSSGAPFQVEVHQLVGSFDPDTATWSNNSSYGGTPLSFLTVDPSASGTCTFYGTAAFTQAVKLACSGSGPGAIYLSLLAPSVESGTASGSMTDYVGFNSQMSDPTQNPMLVVTYNFDSGTLPPVITSSAVAAGTVNTPFGYTITAINNPTSFSTTGTLPAGLSLRGSTGEISGTATQVGSTHVAIGASNVYGTGTADLAININSVTTATNLALISGNNQFGVSGSFTPYPLVVQAGTLSGTTSGTFVPLANTLVTFTAIPGMGLLSATNTSTSPRYSSLTVVTDTDGYASAYLMMPQTLGATPIVASSGSAAPVLFLESTVASSQGPTSTGTASLGNDVPVLSVIGGANQDGPAGITLPNPIVVQATNHLGMPVSSLLLGLQVISGSGGISNSSRGSFGSTLNLNTNSNGRISVYLQPGGSNGTLNTVSCTGTSASGVAPTIALTALTVNSSGTASPGGNGATNTDTDPNPLLSPQATVSETDGLAPYYSDADPTKITISWSASIPGVGSTNADGYIIQEQVNGGSWNTIGVAGASTFSYTQSGLLAGQYYNFRVISTRGTYRSQPAATVSYKVPLIKGYTWEENIIYGGTYINAGFGNPALGYNGGWGYIYGGAFNFVIAATESGSTTPQAEMAGRYQYLLNPSVPTAIFHWVEDTWAVASDVTTFSVQELSYSGGTQTDIRDLYAPSLSPAGSWAGSETGPILPLQVTGFNLDAIDNPTVPITSRYTPTATLIGPVYGTLNWPFSTTLSFSNTKFTILESNGVPIPSTMLNNLDNVGINYGIQANSTTQPGDTMQATYTTYVQGIPVGSSSVTFVYKPPTPDYSMPIDESSGPTYRKVAMNGLPLPDEKPQQKDETDQEKEETFVDALTLGLRHSTTDAYLPVAGSDFSVSARRDFRSEVWSLRNGLRPHEQPDHPFGVCWSSNLAPNVHIATYQGSPAQTQPNTATVTDETGAVHSFIIWTDPNTGVTHYFPKPTAKNEQTPNLETLTENAAVSGTTYTFHRKYGATLTFEQTNINLTVSNDRVVGSQSSTLHTYARLVQAVDRLGNTINYHFIGDTTLVPATITVANQPDTKLSIKQDSNGHIAKIWDAKGNETDFRYSQTGSYDSDANGVAMKEWELTSVVTADGTTSYSYGPYVNENDQTPHLTTDPGNHYWHADLVSIKDPNQHTYQFSYAIDNSKLNYMANPDVYTGYYVQSGQPQTVSKITMPDGTVSYFKNACQDNGSQVWIQFDSSGKPVQKGQRYSKVWDASGFLHTYTFGDSVVIPIPNLATAYSSNNFTDSKMICYQTMTVDYGDPSNGTHMGSETYHFDISAGMAIKQITDFSGNTTTFTHTDPWSDTAYRNLMGELTYQGWDGSSLTFNGTYNDPNTQTNALGQTKSFAYEPVARIMTDVTDEAGRHTHYTVDNLQRRTQEAIYPTPTSTTPVQVTDFQYTNAKYPGFMTLKTVEALNVGGSDPSWTKPLVTQYVPDADGRIAQEIVDPGGLNLITSYTYDANGNKLSATDPRGNTTWFTYDMRNRLVSTTFADGSQKQFVYDARGNKIQEIDENGYQTLYCYDALNRVKKQARDMNGNGAIDSGTDIITQFAYNSVGSGTSTIDPNGHVTIKTYDLMQRLQTTVDALGHTTQYIYGTNSGANGFDSSAFKPTRSIDPRGIVTDVTYDALYRPLVKSVQYQPGAVAATSTVYDAVGNPIITTDPLGHQTTGTFDALNRLMKTTYADGTTTTGSYTSTGFKWNSIDENGVSTQTQYDAAGRVFQVVADAGHLNATTTNYYDPAGNVAATINANNNEIDYSYDARNRRIQEFDPPVWDAVNSGTAHPVHTTVYDLGGRITAIIDPRGYETDRFYDPANRAIEVEQPLVATASGSARPTAYTAYDFVGNVTSVTDPDGHVTANGYDALNRITSSTDAVGIVVSYAYDQVGNRLQVTDGKGNITSFTYDGLNRNTTVTDPLGDTTQYLYDALNKTQRIDALHQTTSYFYDARNRLLVVDYDSSSAINSLRNYSYDAVGNLLSVTEPAKSGMADVAYTYDNLRRVATETSGSLTHQYTYDLVGNRTNVQYGGTGLTIGSSYDTLNRLSMMTESGTHTTTYGYDLSGNAAKKILPNGDTVTGTFDAINRVTAQAAISDSSSPLYIYAYGYDLAGNLLTEGETYSSGLNNRTVTNTYDNIYRLLSEVDATSSNTGTTSYTYDNANNRTSKVTLSSTSTVSGTFLYNAFNQLTAYTNGTSSYSLTYDGNGNRATCTNGTATDTYSYDFENRLVGLVKNITGSNITTGTYAYSYDYRTRRVLRDESGAGGVSTKAIFSGGLSVQELDNGSTIPTVQYIRGSDYGGGVGGMLYTLRSGVPSYTHENRRGDVVAKTGATGSLTYQAAYDAFGKRTQESGSTLDRQKGNTKDEDPTGLKNEGHRYLDLETGCFINADPAGMVDGPNEYTYVKQNPWTKFDPEGLALQDIVNGVSSFAYNGFGIGQFQRALGDAAEKAAMKTGVPWVAGVGGAINGLEHASANMVTPKNYADTATVDYKAGGGGFTGVTSVVNRYNPFTMAESTITGNDTIRGNPLSGWDRVANGASAFLSAMGIKAGAGKLASFVEDASQPVPSTEPAPAALKPYSTSRPPYAEGQVEQVWENAKQGDGKVYDPHTFEEIVWDRTKPRNGQWDMGHQGRTYKELHDDYMSGRITKEKFLKEYRDPKNYAPQTVSGNRSRKFD